MFDKIVQNGKIVKKFDFKKNFLLRKNSRKNLASEKSFQIEKVERIWRGRKFSKLDDEWKKLVSEKIF